LPFDTPCQTRPGYINVSLFKPTQETFIISELPQTIREEYNIPCRDQPPPDASLAPFPVVNLSGARTDRYGYLASAQNTKFALVPIHTNEEYRLFNSEVLKFLSPSSGQPDFKAMAKWWSSRVDGKTIFFKIPEHLQAHFKAWSAVRDEMTTMHMSVKVRAGFVDLIHSDAHTSIVLDESFSPVVQARRAASSSATVATRNRRTAAVKPAVPLSVPSPTPRQVSFISTNPGPAAGPSLFAASSTAPGTFSLEVKKRKGRACKVCQDQGKDGRECRGRGGQKLCPYYRPSGTGQQKLV